MGEGQEGGLEMEPESSRISWWELFGLDFLFGRGYCFCVKIASLPLKLIVAIVVNRTKICAQSEIETTPLNTHRSVNIIIVLLKNKCFTLYG